MKAAAPSIAAGSQPNTPPSRKPKLFSVQAHIATKIANDATPTRPWVTVGARVTRSAMPVGPLPRSRYQPIGAVGALPMPTSRSVLAASLARVTGKLTPAGRVESVYIALAVPSMIA